MCARACVSAWRIARRWFDLFMCAPPVMYIFVSFVVVVRSLSVRGRFCCSVVRAGSFCSALLFYLQLFCYETIWEVLGAVCKVWRLDGFALPPPPPSFSPPLVGHLLFFLYRFGWRRVSDASAL